MANIANAESTNEISYLRFFRAWDAKDGETEPNENELIVTRQCDCSPGESTIDQQLAKFSVRFEGTYEEEATSTIGPNKYLYRGPCCCVIFLCEC